MEYINLFTSGIAVLVSLYVLHKIRLVHIATFHIEEFSATAAKESTQIYAQVQAYMDLLRIVEPTMPLPTLRGWAASPDFLVKIAEHVRGAKPEMVLECSSGASTLIVARCLQLNGKGHVFSLEHDVNYAAHTRELLMKHELSEWATVVDAPLVSHHFSRTPWYGLENLKKINSHFDFLVIDGPPNALGPLARYPALPFLLGRMSNKCVVYLDDSDRVEEKEILARWLEEFPEFEQTQISCEKGCARLDRRA